MMDRIDVTHIVLSGGEQVKTKNHHEHQLRAMTSSWPVNDQQMSDCTKDLSGTIIFSAYDHTHYYWLEVSLHKKLLTVEENTLLYLHSICLKGVEEASLFKIQPENFWTEI